jgi:two-component system, chemotaxis family, CheB/CheR fusion protein
VTHSSDLPTGEVGLLCPIIAVGTSAGGLEALEQFFAPVPAACGYAFVVIQHLDPAQPSLLVELLQRATPLAVVEITDRVAVQPDCIYVLPPGRDAEILRNVLHLMEPAEARGLRLPIDRFFRSLADDCGPLSIAVVLSGMGADGTLGVRAIKASAGAVFVQEPESARFASMPRSVVDAGLADVSARAPALYPAIVEYLRRLPRLRLLNDRQVPEDERAGIEKIVLLLRSQTGHDFSQYKLSTLWRRIERRISLHHLEHVGDYVRYVRENPAEGTLLFKEMLIGVTSFFRDPPVWAALREHVLPAVLAARASGTGLRAWVVACSTGEEAYTLAIVCREVFEDLGIWRSGAVQIFATDLDGDAIARARSAEYLPNIAADVSPERLDRWFVQTERGFRIGTAIREMVVFAPQNLVMDPPFTRLDIVTCRNLLIYLAPELQRKVIPLFHHALREGGVLMLGSAETIGSATMLFAPLATPGRIYRRLATAEGIDLATLPAVFHPPTHTAPASPATLSTDTLQSAADHLLLSRHAPAAVLVGDRGDILYVSGRTGRYLEPAAGKANWNVFAMARKGLAAPLNEGFWRALRTKAPVTLHNIPVGIGRELQHVRVTIDPLEEPAVVARTVLIVFTDLAAPQAEPRHRRRGHAPDEAREALEHHLEESRLALLTAREDMQVSQEELRSTNEELQSTNEELQSANEELTTSKEELQSMNEELQTVNKELQSKLEELSMASTDMANLLNSTHIATLFLDRTLRVRRFTTSATHIIHLIASDVGRPITDLTAAVDVPALLEKAADVMRTLRGLEQEVEGRDGRWFAVHILPYRTQDDRIDGVVLTFNDITRAKSLEAALRAAQAVLEGRLADSLEQQRDASTTTKAP